MAIAGFVGRLAALLGLAFCPALCRAQHASEPLTISAEVSLLSDYRYRGVSLSDRDPAIQGALSLRHASGVGLGIWGSRIARTERGARAEIDLSASYATRIADGAGLDLALTYLTYPSDSGLNYAELSAQVSQESGAWTPSLGLVYAPAQSALRNRHGGRDDNLYLWGGLDYAVTHTPVTLSARAGYENGPQDYAAGPRGKWDWQIGACVELGKATVGLSYVDTDAHVEDDGKPLAGATVLASATIAF